MYALSSRQSFKRTLSKNLSAGFTKAQLPDAEEPSRIVVIEKPSTKLGLQVGWNDGASAGLVVQLVTDDSPAKGLLQKRDVIVSVNGLAAATVGVDELRNELKTVVGRVELVVKGASALNAAPKAEGAKVGATRLQLALLKPTDGNGYGVTFRDEHTGELLVHELEDGRPFSAAGVKVGDKVASIDGTPTPSLLASSSSCWSLLQYRAL